MKTPGFDLSLRRAGPYGASELAARTKATTPSAMASTPQHSSHNPTRPHLYQTLVRIAYDISHIGIIIHEHAENNENHTQASVLRHINS